MEKMLDEMNSINNKKASLNESDNLNVKYNELCEFFQLYADNNKLYVSKKDASMLDLNGKSVSINGGEYVLTTMEEIEAIIRNRTFLKFIPIEPIAIPIMELKFDKSSADNNILNQKDFNNRVFDIYNDELEKDMDEPKIRKK